jgi:hypothetical protein
MLRGGLGPRNSASRWIEAPDDGEATGAANGSRGCVAGRARAHEVEVALYPGPTREDDCGGDGTLLDRLGFLIEQIK